MPIAIFASWPISNGVMHQCALCASHIFYDINGLIKFMVFTSSLYVFITACLDRFHFVVFLLLANKIYLGVQHAIRSYVKKQRKIQNDVEQNKNYYLIENQSSILCQFAHNATVFAQLFSMQNIEYAIRMAYFVDFYVNICIGPTKQHRAPYLCQLCVSNEQRRKFKIASMH